MLQKLQFTVHMSDICHI